MFSSIRDRYGAAGLIVAIIALVAALAGGAYAASGGLTGKQKKEVTKIAKQNSGKPGPAGPAGSNGSNGAKGDKGDSGTNGTNGTNGAEGKSVEAKVASVSECPSGGTKFEIGGVNKGKACNGETGFTETLPKEKTETGTWGLLIPSGGGGNLTTISFAIPLAGALDGSHVLALPEGFEGEDEGNAEEEKCPGSAEKPHAAPGFLCIYTGVVAGPPPLSTEGIELIYNPGLTGQSFQAGASQAGAGLILKEEGGVVSGTWAVTAP